MALLVSIANITCENVQACIYFYIVTPTSASTDSTLSFAHFKTVSEAFVYLTTKLNSQLSNVKFFDIRRACITQMRTQCGVRLSEEAVKSCTDLDSLFDTLSETPYWSWIDIRLLEAMAAASGLVESMQLISNYKQSVFSKRLIDVLPNAPSKAVKDEYYTRLVTMIGKDDLTVIDLFKFRSQLENVIEDINKGVCRLEHLMDEKKVNKAMVNFMLEACRKGKTMKVQFGRVLFSGVSAAGKTNFYNLLLNKKFQARHISTGLHESERVSAMKISMQCSESNVQFIVLDFKKEIEVTFKYPYKTTTTAQSAGD